MATNTSPMHGQTRVGMQDGVHRAVHGAGARAPGAPDGGQVGPPGQRVPAAPGVPGAGGVRPVLLPRPGGPPPGPLPGLPAPLRPGQALPAAGHRPGHPGQAPMAVPVPVRGEADRLRHQGHGEPATWPAMSGPASLVLHPKHQTDQAALCTATRLASHLCCVFCPSQLQAHGPAATGLCRLPRSPHTELPRSSCEHSLARPTCRAHNTADHHVLHALKRPWRPRRR